MAPFGEVYIGFLASSINTRMYYAIYLAVWLLLPLTGFWPMVSVSGHWSNNNIGIDVVDRAEVTQETFLRAYAEEVSEWYFKAVCFGILVMPFAIFVAGRDPLLNVAAVMLMHIAPVLTLIPIMTRTVEYVGKSANIAVSPRDTTGSATRLLKYYSAFAGMEIETIKRGIERTMPLGRALVWLLGRNIRRHASV